jgi:hypothetical protein
MGAAPAILTKFFAAQSRRACEPSPIDDGVTCCAGLTIVVENVHYFRMKNVTLSADENLIEQARLIAKAQRRTLNAAFREWLEQFTGQSRSTKEFDSLMKHLKHVRTGRRFTRDEMNER